jgi:selenocysteine lyase/cysteine desulfurase
MIYFDSGATTLQKPPAVARATACAVRHFASPGRGGYGPAMLAAESVYRCRLEAAALFDAAPEQVVFTMNATHGLNIAIKTLVGPGDEAVISGFEHNSVARPLYHLGAKIVVAGRKLFDEADTLASFDRAIGKNTKAVIVTHVSNVFGYVLPVEKIAKLCRERNVPFVLDASQSAGTLPVSLKNLGAAFIAAPGHKGLYGPSGTGVLLCASQPKTLLEGGSGSVSKNPDMPDFLPDRLEAGTANTAGICGLAEGIRFVRRLGTEKIFQKERDLARLLVRELTALPDAEVFSGPGQAGAVSFLIRGEDCEKTAERLAAKGVCVRAGLHCAPLAHESAGTLESGTVRVSFSAFNTPGEVRRFVKLLKK